MGSSRSRDFEELCLFGFDDNWRTTWWEEIQLHSSCFLQESRCKCIYSQLAKDGKSYLSDDHGAVPLCKKHPNLLSPKAQYIASTRNKMEHYLKAENAPSDAHWSSPAIFSFISGAEEAPFLMSNILLKPSHAKTRFLPHQNVKTMSKYNSNPNKCFNFSSIPANMRKCGCAYEA